MKQFIILTLFFFCLGNIYAEKKPIPDNRKWGQSGERENNSPQLYQNDSKEYKPTIQLNGYNSNTSFNGPWEDEIEALNGELYCRVCFELKHKTTSEIIGYSKYFKVNVVKGTHSHSDIVL